MIAHTETTASGGAGEDHGTLAVGSRVGRYTIVSVLGQGGFGVTYRAHDAELHRDVALKEYLPVSLAVREGSTVLPRTTRFVADFTAGRDRFIKEGRTLASLHKAPAIVRVFDFLQANGTAYIVMELLQGITLEQRLATRGRLTADEVTGLAASLLDGLEQVHAAGFLHRDIKPANIILDGAGEATLIDFGAARGAGNATGTGTTAIFTPGYGAPEQVTASQQGP